MHPAIWVYGWLVIPNLQGVRMFQDMEIRRKESNKEPSQLTGGHKTDMLHI